MFVCTFLWLAPELIGDKVGALEAETKISAGFMEGFPSPKAQNSHPSIFSSFFAWTYKNAMFVSFSFLRSWRRKWWQSTSVWWIRWLIPGGLAKCVGFNCSKVFQLGLLKASLGISWIILSTAFLFSVWFLVAEHQFESLAHVWFWWSTDNLGRQPARAETAGLGTCTRMAISTDEANFVMCLKIKR